MGYFQRRYGRSRPPLSGVADVVQSALDMSSDPYLPELVCRVRQLKAIKDSTEVPACLTTAPDLPGGVGLHKVMTPMRAFVYAEQNPWVYVAAVAALLGVPFFVGYEFGRGRKP